MERRGRLKDGEGGVKLVDVHHFRDDSMKGWFDEGMVRRRDGTSKGWCIA